MKRLLVQLTRVSLGAALLIFITGQSIHASSKTNPLENQIKKAISHYYAEPFSITATDNGIVTIHGKVPVLYDRLRIFEIVAQIGGVREIKDEVVVDVPMIADKMIEASLIEKIAMNHAISEPERIKVSVDNGVVFLNGNVSLYREKLAANTIASWEKGVKGIEDKITITGAMTKKTDQQLSVELQDILKYQFPHEKNVSVSVQDGVATLTGSTRTLSTADQMVKGLSDVLGVQKVVSSLKLAE
jgi:osmotically-inducible protein OsmY